MFSVNMETSTLNEAMNVCLIALQNIYQIPEFQHFLFPLVPLTNTHKLANLKYRLFLYLRMYDCVYVCGWECGHPLPMIRV